MLDSMLLNCDNVFWKLRQKSSWIAAKFLHIPWKYNLHISLILLMRFSHVLFNCTKISISFYISQTKSYLLLFMFCFFVVAVLLSLCLCFTLQVGIHQYRNLSNRKASLEGKSDISEQNINSTSFSSTIQPMIS